MIDWASNASAILLNPRMPAEQRELWLRGVPLDGAFAGHLWLATSGTTGAPKCVALSKTAILASAAAVNAHLSAVPSDVWVNPLPRFHVGGLGIDARAFLAGAQVVDFSEKWSAASFHRLCTDCGATLTALVPAQLYDLVAGGVPAPPTLRGLVVGGGRLDATLYARASSLGWPVLPSYGLTEACSQVATARWADPSLVILPHVEVRISEEGFIGVKGPSLLTAYATIEDGALRLDDPKKDGWFWAEDCGELNGTYLTVKGRQQDFIKVGGESVSMVRLEVLLEQVKAEACVNQPTALFSAEDERLGHVVHLAVEGVPGPELEVALLRFHQQTMPFERIRRIHVIDRLPRTPLGKLNRSALRLSCMVHD